MADWDPNLITDTTSIEALGSPLGAFVQSPLGVRFRGGQWRKGKWGDVAHVYPYRGHAYDVHMQTTETVKRELVHVGNTLTEGQFTGSCTVSQWYTTEYGVEIPARMECDNDVDAPFMHFFGHLDQADSDPNTWPKQKKLSITSLTHGEGEFRTEAQCHCVPVAVKSPFWYGPNDYHLYYSIRHTRGMRSLLEAGIMKRQPGDIPPPGHRWMIGFSSRGERVGVEDWYDVAYREKRYLTVPAVKRVTNAMGMVVDVVEFPEMPLSPYSLFIPPDYTPDPDNRLTLLSRNWESGGDMDPHAFLAPGTSRPIITAPPEDKLLPSDLTSYSHWRGDRVLPNGFLQQYRVTPPKQESVEAQRWTFTDTGAQFITYDSRPQLVWRDEKLSFLIYVPKATKLILRLTDREPIELVLLSHWTRVDIMDEEANKLAAKRTQESVNLKWNKIPDHKLLPMKNRLYSEDEFGAIHHDGEEWEMELEIGGVFQQTFPEVSFQILEVRD